MTKFAPAFIAAKRAFGPALKDKTNPAFRSKYADLGACIDAVEDALLQNGIAFYQETSEDATGVTVETVFLHESGETMRCGKLHVPASKQDPQGYGSALTYCRRYSLMAACGIAPEDDDGNAASKSFRISATMGSEALVPPDRMKAVAACADKIRALMRADDVAGAYELASTITDSEEKTALWGLLTESKIRSALKKHGVSVISGQLNKEMEAA